MTQLPPKARERNSAFSRQRLNNYRSSRKRRAHRLRPSLLLFPRMLSTTSCVTAPTRQRAVCTLSQPSIPGTLLKPAGSRKRPARRFLISYGASITAGTALLWMEKNMLPGTTIKGFASVGELPHGIPHSHRQSPGMTCWSAFGICTATESLRPTWRLSKRTATSAARSRCLSCISIMTVPRNAETNILLPSSPM